MQNTPLESPHAALRGRFLPVRLALCAALAAAGCGSAETPGRDPAPREETPPTETAPAAWFEFEEDAVDFGTVYPESIHDAYFDLVAAGEGELVVLQVMRSCGCTEGELFSLGAEDELLPVEIGEPYAPGTRFKLRAILNTKGKQGEQDQRVRIAVRDAPELATFSMKAVIEPYLEIEPALIELDTFSTVTGASGEVTVRSAGGAPVVLDAHVYGEDAMTVELEPVEPDAEGRSGEWRVTASALPGAEQGLFSEKMRISTDVVNEHAAEHPEHGRPPHRQELWVRGTVHGVVSAQPQRVTFGRLPGGRTVSRKVILTNLDPDFDMSELQVRVEEGELEGAPQDFLDACVVDARMIEPGRRWQLEISLTDPPRAGVVTGRVVVRIGHRFQDEVEIPFKAATAGAP